MNLAELCTYVSTEIGWFHLVNVILVAVIVYQGYRIHELNNQIKHVWYWCKITEELDRRTNKRIEKLERH